MPDGLANKMFDRREILRAIGIGAGLVAGESLLQTVADRGRAAAQTAAASTVELTAAQAAAAIRNGSLSAEAYAESLIAQGATWGHLNAFISHDPDALLAAARAADERQRAGEPLGPLHGVPLVLKDNIDTVDLPTTGGTAALRDHRPGRNAPVAQALFDAGAILFGKTNLHELAMGITNNNGVFGAVGNPYDPSMIPGGSSGGTGAAIGARIAPAGLGSDTGGSVRIPAALCGIAGLRPSSGRYPGAGIVPISSTNDTAGPMARDATDLALLDAAITGDYTLPAPLPLSGLRLGIHRAHFWEDLDAQTAGIMERVLFTLRIAGVEWVERSIPMFQELRTAMGFAARQEVRTELARYLEESGSGIDVATLIEEIGSPDVQAFVAEIFDGPGISDSEYREAMEVHRPRYQAAYAEYFSANRVDAMIFPATPLPARPIGHDDTVELNGRQVPTFSTYVRNTAPASGAGIPGLVVPAGLTEDGLPVGLEIDGPFMSDRRLLAIGLAIERELPEPLPPEEPGDAV